MASLKCHWISSKKKCKGFGTIRKTHFRSKNLVLSTNLLCVGAPVAISGINVVPEVGLYISPGGIIIDIVYDIIFGPNNKHDYHLPQYVVIDFPLFKLIDNIKPQVSNHPTVSLTKLFIFALLQNRTFQSS